MGRQLENPFRPGWGESPPFLAGREEATRELGMRLERICRREPGSGIMLYGPRGNGKTVLLRKLLKSAKERDVTTRTLTADIMLQGEEVVAHRIQTGNAPAKRVLKKAEVGAFNVGGSGEFEQSQPLAFTVALYSLLEKKPVILAVDEAHIMPVDFGRNLFQTAQDMIVDGLPLLLVIAGTPGLHANLRKMKVSFWERSPQFPIGRLISEDDIRRAFSVPAEQHGLPMDEDALALLVSECQGYPFFIQLLGAAAWNAATTREGATRIELRDAQAGMAHAGPAKDNFYLRRYEEADDQRLLGAATVVSREMMARNPDPFLRDHELNEILLEASAGSEDVSRALKEGLMTLGFIWNRPDGSWEPGIPSLCAYFVKRADEVPGNAQTST